MKTNTGSKKTLKFEKLVNVDYASIYRTSRSVLEIDGSEIEGKTWREFQIYLGTKIPPGKCQFTLKFKGSPELHTGQVRAVVLGEPYQSNPKDEIKMSEQIIKEFSSLKEALSKATNQGGVSFEMLLASTKQAYEAQIQYKDQVISDKNDLIREIKKQVDDLENDLNDCEKESSKNTSLSNYLAIGEKILSMKFGTPAKVSLKESNPSDIPDQILQVLGIVNWQIIDAENINRIASNIQQYLSALPKEYLKGQL